MSEELRVSIDPAGAQNLEKLFQGLEKVAVAAGKLSGSGKSLEELRKIMVGLGKGGSSFAELTTSIRALEAAVQALPTQMLTAMQGFNAMPQAVKKAYDSSVTEVKTGGARMASAVKREVAELQAAYARWADLESR